MLGEIIKGLFTEKVAKLFMQYTSDHLDSLPTQVEKNALIRLLNNDDEFTDEVLEQLWSEFKATRLTEEKVSEILSEIKVEVEKMFA